MTDFTHGSNNSINNNNITSKGDSNSGVDSYIPDFDIKVENLCENNCPKVTATTTDTAWPTPSLNTLTSSLSNRSPALSPVPPVAPTGDRSNFAGNKNQSLKQRINNLVIKTLAENSEKDKQSTAIAINTPGHTASVNTLLSMQNFNTTSAVSKTGIENNNNNNNNYGNGNLFVGDTWKIKVLQFTRVISNVMESKFVTEAIFKSAVNNEPIVVSVDCEGINLGIKGTITLVEIGTIHGEAFIFDILQCPEIMDEGGLKSLLESEKVIKIIHDCRNDSVNLFVQFKVLLRNVFDTQVSSN